MALGLVDMHLTMHDVILFTQDDVMYIIIYTGVALILCSSARII